MLFDKNKKEAILMDSLFFNNNTIRRGLTSANISLFSSLFIILQCNKCLYINCLFLNNIYKNSRFYFSRIMRSRSYRNATFYTVLLWTSVTFITAQTISYPSALPVRVCPLPQSIAYWVLPSRGIVVERSPFRSFAADYPFFST